MGTRKPTLKAPPAEAWQFSFVIPSAPFAVVRLRALRCRLQKMLAEMFQHASPRIGGGFGIIDCRPGVIEECVVCVVANDFNWQVVLARGFLQLVYLFRIDPIIALAGNEERRHS